LIKQIKIEKRLRSVISPEKANVEKRRSFPTTFSQVELVNILPLPPVLEKHTFGWKHIIF
jgi:hypothetical protein